MAVPVQNAQAAKRLWLLVAVVLLEGFIDFPAQSEEVTIRLAATGKEK